MTESNHPRIVFSERLSTGIVVHFENDVCVFFPSAFLYEQREAPSNTIISEQDGDEDSQHADAPEDIPYWKVVTKIIGRESG